MVGETMSWLTRIFGPPEEINGRERCPTYLYRWHLLSTRWFKAYLHHFVADDWSLDLHDHPKRFVSIGLKGQYYEITQQRCEYFSAPWVRSFPANHIHRLVMRRGWLGEIQDCWTLCLVFKTVKPWGFYHNGVFIGWREYVGSKLADTMKACGDD